MVSKVLNHVETGVTTVYDRHSHDAEASGALDFSGRRVEAIHREQTRHEVLTFRVCDMPPAGPNIDLQRVQ